jgi:hypothetical protein
VMLVVASGCVQGDSFMVQHEPTLIDQGMLKMEEAIAFSRLSRSELYVLIAKGVLPTVQVNKRRLIPKLALIQFLNSKLTTREKVMA